MEYDIFISYSQEDKAVADAVCANLEGNGVKCWIAPRDILPGLSYGEAIVNSITESSVMVFIFSSHSNKSPHVLRELERAVNKGITIIPFRIEDVFPSKSIEYFIAVSHWLDACPGPSEEHYETLAGTVKQQLVRQKGQDVAEGLCGEHEMNEYEKKLRFAKDLLRRKQWALCTRECGTLFREALKQLLRDLLDSSEDKKVQETIMATQRRIGQGKSSFESFGIDQLINLYTDAGVFGELQKQMAFNLQKTRRIDWDQVVEWYNASKHQRSITVLDEGNAMQMVYWLKTFLYDCELVGGISTVLPIPKEERSLKECPCCKEPLKSDWSFCPWCGVALNVICDACHRALAPDFRICPYCETPARRRGVVKTDDAWKAQEEYRVLCVGVYIDGVASIREKILLDQKRLQLGLSTEEAEEIECQYAPENTVEYTHLVEGMLVDGAITEDERTFLQKKIREIKIDPWVAQQVEDVVIAIRKGTLGDLRKE